MISNIWKHPWSTLSGLLVGFAQIAPVLIKYGITLGTVGGAPILPLATGLATVVLGALVKDPKSGASPAAAAPSSSARVGALMLAMLLIPLPCLQGCTGATVAQDVVNWTPALQAAVATVDSSASLIAVADAPIFTTATAAFDAASNLLVTQAKAYLANPSATTLQQLQAQVVALQQDVNTALLQTAGIKDTASQAQALNAVQAVATIVTAILALVTSISTPAQVAAMSRESPVKLAQVEPYIDFTRAANTLADHYGQPVTIAALDMTIAQVRLAHAGF